jgi:hypothetical protein
MEDVDLDLLGKNQKSIRMFERLLNADLFYVDFAPGTLLETVDLFMRNRRQLHLPLFSITCCC